MKKFEEEIFGKVETMITQPGCSMTRKVWYKADDIHELSKDWVSPEDHQAEINKLKSQLEKQRPEIPEITKKQAEILNDYKNGSGSLAKYLTTEIKKRDYDYFARAWLNGYTVETPKAIVTPCPVCGYEEVESNFCSICGRKNDYE